MIPFAYSHRNLRVRWKTTLMTALGFTLVVTALVVMLAFVNGLKTVCAVTGQEENVLVLNRGSADEALSQLNRSTVAEIEDIPGVSRNSRGQSLASPELFCIVNQRDPKTGKSASYQVRGIRPVALEVHPLVKIEAGRLPRPGQGEMLIGRAVERNLALAVGDLFPLGRNERRVSGVFSSAGAVFESEIWWDLDEMADHFHRDGTCSTVVLRTRDANAARQVARQLNGSRHLSVDAQLEPDYYLQQSQQVQSLHTAGLMVALSMGIGAIFGVANTMFAAIGQRTKDIAVMRLMGFRKHEILISFLSEALLIALVGGALGSALGYSINGFSINSVVSAKSVAFAFTVDAASLLAGLAFTLTLGVLGGILPAWTAMRVDPLQSLR